MKRLVGVWRLVKGAAGQWVDDNALRLAAAVAFYSLLSLAPLLVIAVSVAGLAFGEDAAQGELVGQMRGLVGDAGAEVVQTTLANAKKPEAGIAATVIGVVTLLFGASGVFGELHDALNAIWRVRPKPGRAVWRLARDKLLSFGMVLAVGFLLLVSLVLSTALTALGSYLARLAPDLPVLMGVVNFAVSLLVVTGLFALIFRYLPDARVPWRHVWFGAVATAGLFTLGKYLIGVYLVKAAVGSPFGAAGSLVALVVWVYYSALIVFFGAELTQVHARLAGVTVPPTAAAERVPEPHPGRAA